MRKIYASHFLTKDPEGVGEAILVLYTQRFSKPTIIAISPLQKHPLNENFAQFSPKFTPKQAFLEGMFGPIWKMTPKRRFVSKKWHILTFNRDSRESHQASKNNPFFTFLWSCMCTTLLFQWPPLGQRINHNQSLFTSIYILYKSFTFFFWGGGKERNFLFASFPWIWACFLLIGYKRQLHHLLSQSRPCGNNHPLFEMKH